MELECIKCGCELETDDTIDIDHKGASISCFEIGHCPNCHTNYEWTAYFTFDRIGYLMESDDDEEEG